MDVVGKTVEKEVEQEAQKMTLMMKGSIVFVDQE